MSRPLNWQQIADSFLAALPYIPQTLLIAVCAFLIAHLLGLGVVLVRVARIPVLTQVIDVIIVIIKGIPIYLSLIALSVVYTLYFDQVMQALGLPFRQQNISLAYLGVVILALDALPPAAEGLMGAYLSVGQDQYEAGYVTGLTRGQIIRRIVIPQMIPAAIPILSNNFVYLLKTTALCSMIGITEVLSVSVRVASVRFDLLEAYIAAALIYWILFLIINKGMKLAERYSSRFREKVVA